LFIPDVVTSICSLGSELLTLVIFLSEPSQI